MPRLITVAAVQARLALSSAVADEAALVGGIIDRAGVVIAEHLMTPLDRAARTDTFLIDRTRLRGRRSFLQLRLSAGLVDAAVTVTAYRADTVADLAAASTRDDLRDYAGVDYVQVDADHGLVTLHGLRVRDSYVRVGYTAGLYAASDDAYEDVPAWLVELAHTKVAADLVVHPSYRTGKEFEPRGRTAVELRRDYNRMLAARARTFPSAVRPLFSSAA